MLDQSNMSKNFGDSDSQKIPQLFEKCPKCGYKTAEGPAGGIVCDNCGWYYREYKYTPPETPLYGVIGGPMGACKK
jgi:ribosomal protein L37AE/L43A